MARNISLKGTPNKTYDLDQIQKQSRTNSEEELIVQVWEWSPSLPKSNPHSSPNPPNLVVGQIWFSKKLDPETEADKIEALR